MKLESVMFMNRHKQAVLTLALVAMSMLMVANSKPIMVVNVVESMSSLLFTVFV